MSNRKLLFAFYAIGLLTGLFFVNWPIIASASAALVWWMIEPVTMGDAQK